MPHCLILYPRECVSRSIILHSRQTRRSREDELSSEGTDRCGVQRAATVDDCEGGPGYVQRYGYEKGTD